MDGFDTGWLDRIREGLHDNPLMRSGMLMILTIGAVLAVSYGLWYEHVQGAFHRLRIVPVVVDKITVPRPGNMDVVRLTRESVVANLSPEFLSATFAPGLGMQMLGATVNLPTGGEVSIVRGTGDNANGKPTDNSTGFPFVVTVAGRNGAHWTEPFSMLRRQPDHVAYNAMPDGGESDSTFDGNAADIPLADSGVATKVSITMGNHALDVVIVAKNNATQPRAVVLGWEPRFLLSGSGLTFTPPRLETTDAAPTPILVGTRDIKAVYTRLKRSYLINGPDAQLRNEAAGYILHVVGISPSAQSLQIEAKKGDSSMLIAFSTAVPDGAEATPKVLEPGESLQLHVRVEVTAVPAFPRASPVIRGE